MKTSFFAIFFRRDLPFEKKFPYPEHLLRQGTTRGKRQQNEHHRFLAGAQRS
jgi:hypothetical protein